MTTLQVRDLVSALIVELECQCPKFDSLHDEAMKRLAEAEAVTANVEETIVSLLVLGHKMGLYDGEES